MQRLNAALTVFTANRDENFDGDRAFLSGSVKAFALHALTCLVPDHGTGKPGTRKEASSVSKFRPA
jgi:hypothetical protein